MSAHRKDERLLGKLILSSALVLVSAAYGAWQKTAPRPRPLAVAALSAPPVIPSVLPAPAPAADRAPSTALPDGGVAAPPVLASAPPVQTAPAAMMAKAAPDAVIAKAGPPPADSVARASAAPVATPPAALAAPPGAAIYAEAGSHIEDGEYTSAPKEFQWGTLQIQAQIKNGVFTDIRFLQIPDHRPQSTELSDLSKPILVAETIRDQKAGVDIVSSATYTSFAYQDALTDVIVRATRR